MRILAGTSEHGNGWIVSDNYNKFSSRRRPLYHHATIQNGDVTIVLGSYIDYREAQRVIERWMTDPDYRAKHQGSAL